MRLALLPLGGADEVDALVTDLYLHSLLGQADAAAPSTPDGDAGASQAIAPEVEADVDAALLHAARVIRASLLRAHPSFRFEERLAAELAAAASSGASRSATRIPGAVIPFPSAASRPGDPLLAAVADGRLDPADDLAVERAASRTAARPLIVGGAITSAAISLVGVAWVAWRASRPATRRPAHGASPHYVGTPRVTPPSRLGELADLAEYAAGLRGGPA